MGIRLEEIACVLFLNVHWKTMKTKGSGSAPLSQIVS